MKYYFFFVDRTGQEYRYYNLSKSMAINMYKIFNTNMATHQYKKIGWSIDN